MTREWRPPHSDADLRAALDKHPDVRGHDRDRQGLWRVELVDGTALRFCFQEQYTFGIADFEALRRTWPHIRCVVSARHWQQYSKQACQRAEAADIDLLDVPGLLAWLRGTNSFVSTIEAELRRVADTPVMQHVVAAYIFGSATWKPNPSDVDLLFVWDERRTTGEQAMSIRETLTPLLAAAARRPVDIVLLTVDESADGRFVEEEAAQSVYRRATESDATA